MLNKYARAFFTRVLTPFAAFLLRRGVSPDAVTLVGTAGVVAGALAFYPRGQFFWGTVVITCFVFSDLVDGNMARQMGRSSRWGAFLDSTLDRVADGAVFGGLAMWYAGSGDNLTLCAVTIFCLASGQVVSYTKARGEAIGLPVNVNGLVERSERLVITLVLCGLAGFHRTFGVPGIQWLLPVALWVVAVGSLITLIQRVVTVRRESAEADEAAALAQAGQGERRVKERLTDGLYGLGWSAVKTLPEPAARALGRTIADAAWRQRGKGVARLEANLKRVVPDADEARLRELSKAGMRSYLRYWMESFRLPAWSKDRIRGGFDPADVHYLTGGLAAGNGVILALPHMGNYDLAGAWVTTKLETPFTTVAERLDPETLYDRFVAYREGLGMEVLPHTGGAAFGTLARRLRAGGLVCLVADRDLSAGGVEVEFFGEKTRMPAGPAMLAQQTGALLLPVTLWYDESPVMQGRVHPPVDVPAGGDRASRTKIMTQALADAYASGIAEHPQDWHMLQRLWLADLPPRPLPPVAESPGTENA